MNLLREAWPFQDWPTIYRGSSNPARHLGPPGTTEDAAATRLAEREGDTRSAIKRSDARHPAEECSRIAANPETHGRL